MSIIEELKKDSEEFAKLSSESTRNAVKDVLISAKAEVDRKILHHEMTSRRSAIDTVSTQKRYLVELSEYAWDQSDKFVKLFVTLEGVQNIDECNVSVSFTETTMHLLVNNLNGKDYGLTVNNLLQSIDIEKSYYKVKTGLVAIYMKKKKEVHHWDHLTTIQKRLKEKQDKQLKSETEGPEDALVNIMKKMYNSGDAKTKQMIAKAWTESQEKAFSEM